MPQTIDVTGLSPETIQAVETLIDGLREKRTPEGELVQSQWPGPAPGERTEEYVKRWRAFVYGRVAAARRNATTSTAANSPSVPATGGAVRDLQGERL